MKKRLKTKSTQATPRNDISSRILPVSDVPVYIKMLAYGRSGTGKTHLLGTAPGPTLILDIKEDGTTTVRKQPGVHKLEVRTWADIEEVYWYLKEGKHEFKTVAIDTLTSLQDLAIKQVVGDGRISQRGWGEVSGLMKTWIMNYRDLPMHVIFTAQDRLSAVTSAGEESEEVVFDEDGMILPDMGPYVIPSVAKVLNAAVGVIVNTFIREATKTVKLSGNKGTKTKRIVLYSLRVGPHARYTTKLRCDTSGTGVEVPSLIDDPTFDKILKLSLGGED